MPLQREYSDVTWRAVLTCRFRLKVRSGLRTSARSAATVPPAGEGEGSDGGEGLGEPGTLEEVKRLSPIEEPTREQLVSYLLRASQGRCQNRYGAHHERGRRPVELKREEYGVTWRLVRLTAPGRAGAVAYLDHFAMCNNCAGRWERLAQQAEEAEKLIGSPDAPL